MNHIAISICTAAALLLSACGGGENDGPSVSNLQSTVPRYSQTLTVTVTGQRLDSNIEMGVDGPCGGVVAVGAATSTQALFSCVVSGVGEITPRVRNTTSRRELGSLKLEALTPQVTIAVNDGTRGGSFVVELDPAKAKLTVDNFLAYVNNTFYTNTIFHRVIAGFVAQGGGFTVAEVDKPAIRPGIKNEASNGLSNLRGSIAMARGADPDSATSQFYLNLVDNFSLDPGGVSPDGYAVFGRVISGLNVVDEIGAVPTRRLASPFENLPVTQVRITTARQTQ